MKLLKIEALYTIAIDRTEWQLGKSWVNVLLLCVTYKSLSIPIFWTVTGEKGCSDNEERKAILEKFIAEFGLESIRFVTREARVLLKGMVSLFDKKSDFISVANQGELSNNKCERSVNQSLKTVPDLKDRRKIRVKRSAFIVESLGLCGSLQKRRRG